MGTKVLPSPSCFICFVGALVSVAAAAAAITAADLFLGKIQSRKQSFPGHRVLYCLEALVSAAAVAAAVITAAALGAKFQSGNQDFKTHRNALRRMTTPRRNVRH